MHSCLLFLHFVAILVQCYQAHTSRTLSAYRHINGSRIACWQLMNSIELFHRTDIASVLAIKGMERCAWGGITSKSKCDGVDIYSVGFLVTWGPMKELELCSVRSWQTKCFIVNFQWPNKTDGCKRNTTPEKQMITRADTIFSYLLLSGWCCLLDHSSRINMSCLGGLYNPRTVALLHW
jgi:hypothetical protein